MPPIHCINLQPLNRTAIRAFGAMTDPDEIDVMARFAVLILERAAEYFSKLGYKGDDVSSGPRLWFTHDDGYLDNLNLHNPVDVSRVRSTNISEANLEGALKLASLELCAVVPESMDCIKLAQFVSRSLVRGFGRWSDSKNRFKAKGAQKHLMAASQVPISRIVAECSWLVKVLYPLSHRRSVAA